MNATQTSPTTREMAFLDEMRVRATWWVVSGVVAALLGAWLLAGHLLGHVGVVFGFVGVLGGPFFLLVGSSWLRLLPSARVALRQVPVEARLEVQVLKGGYGFNRSTMARLWPAAQADRWLAKFSETMHWQTPRLLAVDRVPAQVYGQPTPGAVVVASCSQGVVVGRLKRSHFQTGGA